MPLSEHSRAAKRDTWPAVVFTINDDYCLPLTVAWQSLSETNPHCAGSLDIQVLYEELTPASENRLRRHATRLELRVKLRRVTLPSIRYPVAFGGSRSNYLRLMIPELIDTHSRILYLDADLLFLGDIRPLLTTEIAGCPLAAVRDPINPAYRFGRALPGWSSLGIPADREYFNSGVLLIDRSTGAAAEVFKHAIRFTSSHPEHIRLWDQDALNWAVADNWHRLPLTWNVFPISGLRATPWVRYTAEELMPLDKLIALESAADILHFATPAKPWKDLLPKGAANKLYQGYLSAVHEADMTQDA